MNADTLYWAGWILIGLLALWSWRQSRLETARALERRNASLHVSPSVSLREQLRRANPITRSAGFEEYQRRLVEDGPRDRALVDEWSETLPPPPEWVNPSRLVYTSYRPSSDNPAHLIETDIVPQASVRRPKDVR